MAIIQQELAKYAVRIDQDGLVAGAGGNISARDGRLIWIKPSGFALGELTGRHLCCIDLSSGKQLSGSYKPSVELPMHLAIYQERPDIQAIFHTHSPFASGIISSGAEFKPMFAEAVMELGEIGSVPYLTSSTDELANPVAEQAQSCDTVLMRNHGIVCLGKTMRQAYFRCGLVEDTATSFVAAAVAGTPQFLTEEQISAIHRLAGAAYRKQILEKE